MTSTLPSRAHALWRRYALPMGFVLLAALGNAWAPSVVPGVSYLPGSVGVLLLVSLYGMRWGLVAAAASALPLLMLAEMELAAVLLLEPLVVGAALRRLPRGNLFLAAAVFWLCLGGPLVWWLSPTPGSGEIPLKELAALYQVLVGLTNALVAGLLLTLTPLGGRAHLQQTVLPFQVVLFHFVGGVALILTLLLLSLEGRHEFAKVDEAVHAAFEGSRHAIGQQLAQRLDFGSADTAHLSQLLTEIMISETSNQALELAYIDSEGHPLASTYAQYRWPELWALIADAKKVDLQGDLASFRPAMDEFQDWPDACYWAVAQIGGGRNDPGLAGYLLLSYPIEPLLKTLYGEYIHTLLAGLSILLLGLAVVWWLSRWLVWPLRSLGELAATLPHRLHEEREPEWRDSRVLEVNHLTDSVREMDRRLRHEFQTALRAHRDLLRSNRQLEIEIREHRATAAALAESEGRFRQFAAHMQHAAFWMTTPDGGQVLYVSPAFEEIWGRPIETLYSDWPHSWLEALHPEDRDWLERLMAEQTEPGREVNMEYRIYRPDGTLRWIRNLGFPIYNDVGEFYQYGGIAIDVTAQKVAEDQARQQEGELAHMARLSLASEMSSGLAHELNQPLAAISTYASALQERFRNGQVEPESMMSVLDRVMTQASRAGDIIRRLRHLVRKTTPRRRPECLNELLQGVLELTAHELRVQEVRVRLALAEEPPPVLVDNIQVQQVILNLVRNAAEALQAVPVAQREIVLRTASRGDAMAVRVEDSGPGISEEVAAQLFQPFQTTKEKGMGVGLWISRSLIEGHHGELYAENRPEGGAVFTVVLPCAHTGDATGAPADMPGAAAAHHNRARRGAASSETRAYYGGARPSVAASISRFLRMPRRRSGTGGMHSTGTRRAK